MAYRGIELQELKDDVITERIQKKNEITDLLQRLDEKNPELKDNKILLTK